MIKRVSLRVVSCLMAFTLLTGCATRNPCLNEACNKRYEEIRHERNANIGSTLSVASIFGVVAGVILSNH